jgi:arginyl-tRNA synthetase
VRDLIEWSGNGDITRGRDAVRFFLISRKADTEFVFDVDVALATNDENPVYYVQYAHARICSVLANWGGDVAGSGERRPGAADRAARSQPAGQAGRIPEMLQRAQQELGPHQVAFYLRELAGELHSYYFAHKWLLDDDEPEAGAPGPG